MLPPASIINLESREALHQEPGSTGERYSLVCILVCCFFFSLPNILLMDVNEDHTIDGGGATNVFYALALVIYVSSFFCSAMRDRWRLLRWWRAWPIWINVVYALSSILWSIAAPQTLSRAFALFGTSLAAVLLSTYPPQSQLRKICIAALLVSSFSLLFTLARPDLGIADHKGLAVVRGIYLHKNSAGWTCALLTLLSFGAWRSRVISAPLGFLSFVACGLATVLSQSATGVLSAMFGMALFVVFYFLRKSGNSRPFVLIFLLAIAFVIGAGGLAFIPFVLDHLGKSATFSGRTTLWEALLPAIQDRLILGWGFGGALWTSSAGKDLFKYAFFAGNAQGGYPEILVNSGLLGTFLFFAPYLYTCFGLYSRSNKGDRIAEVALVVMAVMLLMGFSAPIFLATNQIYWVLYSWSVLYIFRRKSTLPQI